VDIAQGYPHFIVASKAFDQSSGLVYSGIEDARFTIQFVTKSTRTKDPVIQKFIRIFQESDAVKAAIDKAFAGDKRLYTLVWTQK
jgi:D-methionine transport system substrate-binding protein